MVAVCGNQPFFGFGDWFIGTTPCCAGISPAVAALTVICHGRLFQRSRKKTVSTYRGYYMLEQNGPRVWKALGTPDKAIAEKRIMEFALQAQRESEGHATSKPIRETATKGLLVLVAEYEKYLSGQDLVQKHVHDTVDFFLGGRGTTRGTKFRRFASGGVTR